MSNKLHIKTGDKVVVLSGTEKGKTGKVLAVSPKEGKVIIEKVVCPHCNKPTRVAHKLLEDGTKERICKKCGEAL